MSRYERNKKNKISKTIHNEIRRQPDLTSRSYLNNLESSSDSDDELIQAQNSIEMAQASFLASNQTPLQNFQNVLPRVQFNPSGVQTLATLEPEVPAACSAAFLDAGKFDLILICL